MDKNLGFDIVYSINGKRCTHGDTSFIALSTFEDMTHTHTYDADNCVISYDDNKVVVHALLIPGKGCIFSDGTQTNGEKFCSRSVRAWIEEHNKQPDFKFIDV